MDPITSVAVLVVIAGVTSGVGLIQARRRKRATIRLLSPELTPTKKLDVERQLDENSPIRSTHSSVDLAGQYRDRDVVARLEYVDEDDPQSPAPADDRSLWIQTSLRTDSSGRASLFWDEPFAIKGDRDLATAIACGRVRKWGQPGDMLNVNATTVGYHGCARTRRHHLNQLTVIMRIVKRLEASDGDLDGLLKENFLSDPDPIVRLESFKCLSRRYKAQPDRQAWLHQEAAKDAHTGVRIAGAKEAGDTQSLRKIAMESNEPIYYRQLSLRSLLSLLPDADREVLLHQLLESAEPPLCLVAIEELGQRGPASLIASLTPMRLLFERQLAIPAIEAINRRPSSIAIPHLVALAEQTSDWHTQKRAVETMGELGDITHVGWLRGLGFHEGTVESAVLKIQSRARGAGGALSVVEAKDNDKGAVSAVSAPEGALSAAPEAKS